MADELPGVVAIGASRLLDLLRRAHAGEDPDALIAEEYANAVHAPVREWVDRLEDQT